MPVLVNVTYAIRGSKKRRVWIWETPKSLDVPAAPPATGAPMRWAGTTPRASTPRQDLSRWCTCPCPRAGARGPVGIGGSHWGMGGEEGKRRVSGVIKSINHCVFRRFRRAKNCFVSRGTGPRSSRPQTRDACCVASALLWYGAWFRGLCTNPHNAYRGSSRGPVGVPRTPARSSRQDTDRVRTCGFPLTACSAGIFTSTVWPGTKRWSPRPWPSLYVTGGIF